MYIVHFTVIHLLAILQTTNVLLLMKQISTAWMNLQVVITPRSSGCKCLELTTRNSRFGINTAVVPAPIENFFYFNDPGSTVIVVSQ